MTQRQQSSTGLPIPRSVDADTRRFFELVNKRLGSLTAETRQIVQRFGPGGTGGTGPGGGTTLPPSPQTPTEFVFGSPILDTPPTPVGLEALGGIGFIMLSWANPFRFYANHAHTNVYRSTTDNFDEAVKIGEAGFMLYPDTNLEGGTTYFYWITWVSDTDVEGLPTESVSATVRSTPEEIYDELTTWLNRDFIDTVLATPTSDETYALIVVEESRRLIGALSLILSSATDEVENEVNDALDLISTNTTNLANATRDLLALTTTVQGKADTTALIALTSQVRDNEEGLTALSTLVNSLRVQIPSLEGIFELGMEPNKFIRPTRAEAENLRDDTTRDGYVAWLADYDNNSTNYILLEYN